MIKTPDARIEAINAYRLAKLARMVPESKRNGTLERHFGNNWFAFENALYNAAGALMPSYSGGYWYFTELPGGCLYMHLDIPETFQLICNGNGYQGHMSGDAIGLVVSMFVYSNLSFRAHGHFQETLASYYHLCSDYVCGGHPEAEEILRAID